MVFEERECVLGMLQIGISRRVISQGFGHHHSTITRLSRGYEQPGTTRDRPRPAQRRVTTPRQDRHIVRDRMLPELHQLFKVDEGSDRLHVHRPYIGSILISAYLGHECIVIGDYNVGIMCYSLTNPVSIRNADGRLWLWLRRGECYHNDCLVQTDRWG